jgi:hypothetical protein
VLYYAFLSANNDTAHIIGPTYTLNDTQLGRLKRHSRIAETDAPGAIARREQMFHARVILNTGDFGDELERSLCPGRVGVHSAVV